MGHRRWRGRRIKKLQPHDQEPRDWAEDWAGGMAWRTIISGSGNATEGSGAGRIKRSSGAEGATVTISRTLWPW